MASYSVAQAKHATLVGATVDTVTLTGGQRFALVRNRDATNPIYVVPNGTPTVAGDDTFVVVPGGEIAVPLGDVKAVSLISAGAAPYSVTGA